MTSWLRERVDEEGEVEGGCEGVEGWDIVGWDGWGGMPWRCLDGRMRALRCALWVEVERGLELRWWKYPALTYGLQWCKGFEGQSLLLTV